MIHHYMWVSDVTHSLVITCYQLTRTFVTMAETPFLFGHLLIHRCGFKWNQYLLYYISVLQFGYIVVLTEFNHTSYSNLLPIADAE